MHTFTASDGTIILYNPDLSEVLINVENINIEDISYLTDITTAEPLSRVSVSGTALLEFITEYYRNKLINDLEGVNIAEFIKGL